VLRMDGLRVGELAASTGLTVRTLHHYDELGLLVPERAEGGARVYRAEHLRRLAQIVALRGLGLSLAQVAELLEQRSEPHEALRRRLAELEREIDEQERLRQLLTRILGALEPETRDYIEAIEVMTMIDKHYTPKQLETLEQRRQELGEDGMAKAQRDWAELIAEFERERAAGTDPADPRAQELAARWQALIEQFTGGDTGIRASLQRMYDEEGAERASRGGVSPELMAYVKEAISAAVDY
jgi:DNA-binding transcriptional MerR regulator